MKTKCKHRDDDNPHTHCTVCVCGQYIQCVQSGHPDACWMTVHFWACIYLPLLTGGNVWEVRSVKPNSTADTHWTTDTHFPLTLGQRSSHTTHRPLPFVFVVPHLLSSSFPPHWPAPCSLSFPTLYHQFNCNTLWVCYLSVVVGGRREQNNDVYIA